jgi:hypothetical protein
VKAILTFIVISMIFASMLASVSAQEVMDLSILGKKPVMDVVSLPQVSTNMPTSVATSTQTPQVIELSTLNRKNTRPAVEPLSIGAAKPITLTPSFSIRNSNVTTMSAAPTVFTLPVAISSNATTVYTPPIAIYGGA